MSSFSKKEINIFERSISQDGLRLHLDRYAFEINRFVVGFYENFRVCYSSSIFVGKRRFVCMISVLYLILVDIILISTFPADIIHMIPPPSPQLKVELSIRNNMN